MINPEDAKAEARLAKLRELEMSADHKDKKKVSDSKALAEIAEATASKKRLQEFDRFDPEFIDAYKLDRSLRRVPEKEAKAQQEAPLQ